MLKVVLFVISFLSFSAFAQQTVIYSDGSLNPGQVYKFVDGEVSCYLATKNQRFGTIMGATLSCTGDITKVSAATSFMAGEVVRLKDGHGFCYYFNSVRANAISCIK